MASRSHAALAIGSPTNAGTFVGLKETWILNLADLISELREMQRQQEKDAREGRLGLNGLPAGALLKTERREEATFAMGAAFDAGEMLLRAHCDGAFRVAPAFAKLDDLLLVPHDSRQQVVLATMNWLRHAGVLRTGDGWITLSDLADALAAMLGQPVTPTRPSPTVVLGPVELVPPPDVLELLERQARYKVLRGGVKPSATILASADRSYRDLASRLRALTRRQPTPTDEQARQEINAVCTQGVALYKSLAENQTVGFDLGLVAVSLTGDADADQIALCGRWLPIVLELRRQYPGRVPTDPGAPAYIDRPILTSGMRPHKERYKTYPPENWPQRAEEYASVMDLLADLVLAAKEPGAEALLDVEAFVRSAHGETRTSGFMEWAGGERITLAIVFTDVVGSTALGEGLKDERMNEVRRAHFAQNRELIKQFQGREIKTMGDGFMTAFRTVEKAMGYALALHANPGHTMVRVRAGIHIGPMQVEENDVFGGTVNFAARVVGNILGSEIWLSDRAKQDFEAFGGQAHVHVKFDRHDGVVMKGFLGSFTLWSVSRPRSPAQSLNG